MDGLSNLPPEVQGLLLNLKRDSLILEIPFFTIFNFELSLPPAEGVCRGVTIAILEGQHRRECVAFRAKISNRDCPAQ